MAIAAWPAYLLGPLFLLVGIAFAAAFYFLASPPEKRWTPPGKALGLTFSHLGQDRVFVLFGVFAILGHIVQVNLLNPVTRAWWLDVTGFDFAGFLYSIEGEFVPSLGALHWGPLLFVMFWVYLVLHNAFIFVAPFFLAYTGERRITRRLLVSYLVIWMLAFPGFTFFPATNPTVYLGLESVLDRVIPGTTELFYRGTTIDNTIPSLHVGLATLIMLHGLHSSNPRFRRTVIVYAPAVAFSVVYLQVHWALDIVAGVIVALLAYAAGLALEKRIAPCPDAYAPTTRQDPGPGD